MKQKMSAMKQFQSLCIKKFSDNISETELKLLNDWLAESDVNRLEYDRIENLWLYSRPAEITEVPDIDKQWASLNRRIENLSGEVNRKGTFIDVMTGFTMHFLTNRWKPVLAGTLALVVLILSLIIFNRSADIPELKTIVTGSQVSRAFQLPDGSMVHLNYASSIQFYSSLNEKEREVRLNGEAYFSVIKDNRPFVVLTGNALTTVLGTKFNVWARGGKTRVYVADGKVRLKSQSANSTEVTISKNQLSAVNNNNDPTTPDMVNSSYLLGWTDGKIVFSETPLAEAVDELKLFYGVNVLLDKEELATRTLTGSFENVHIDSLLTMICLAMDLKYQKLGNDYVIKYR